MGCVGAPAPWLGRVRLAVRGTEAMEMLKGYLAGGMLLPSALPKPKEQRVEQLLGRHLVAPCKFTGGMCFFPDSLLLLYFPFKDSRSLLLLCFKYHQLASLCTHIFPISDSTCKHAGKIYFKFPVYPHKLVLLTTSFSSDFHCELQSHQLNLTVSFLELGGQVNIFFIKTTTKRSYFFPSSNAF